VNRRWPWTWRMRDRLERDVMGFFGAYYSEIRRLTSEVSPGGLAEWVKGKRVTDTYACVDGVIVVQAYPDKIPADAPLKEDEESNLFRFSAAPESLVKELFPSAVPPRRRGLAPDEVPRLRDRTAVRIARDTDPLDCLS
jgi:hypothetical protein